MMSNCISKDCPYYNSCALAVSEGEGRSVDYMNYRRISCDPFEEVKFACGPMAEYALYEPIAVHEGQVLSVSDPTPDSSLYTEIMEHYHNSSTYTVPSRVCALCDALEYPNAETVYNDKFWLCPDCTQKLKDILFNN